MPSAPFNVYYHDEEVFCTVRISHNQPVFADILQAFNKANGVCKIPAARTLFYAVSHPQYPTSFLWSYISISLEDFECTLLKPFRPACPNGSMKTTSDSSGSWRPLSLRSYTMCAKPRYHPKKM